MPTLYYVLTVLENNFNECSVVGVHDRGVEVYAAPRRVALNASNSEDSRNVEEVGDLHGGIWGYEGDTIDCISLFPVDKTRWVSKSYGFSRIDHAVVVGPLWVRPRSTCGKVRSLRTKMNNRLNKRLNYSNFKKYYKVHLYAFLLKF